MGIEDFTKIRQQHAGLGIYFFRDFTLCQWVTGSPYFEKTQCPPIEGLKCP